MKTHIRLGDLLFQLRNRLGIKLSKRLGIVLIYLVSKNPHKNKSQNKTLKKISERMTFWCAFWAGGRIGTFFFGDDGMATVNMISKWAKYGYWYF